MSEQRRIPIETDPLGAIRKELVFAARRRKAARVRRRRLAIVAATILAALATLACASAFTDLRTGIPAIDQVLGNQERNADRSMHGPPARRPSSQLDATPKAGTTNVSIAFPWGRRAQEAVGVLYVSQGDRLCFALAIPGAPGTDRLRGGQRDCHEPQAIATRLADEQVFAAGFDFSDSTVLYGYTSAYVDAVAVTGPHGPSDVRLSDVWRPETVDAGRIRLFLAHTLTRAKRQDRSTRSARDAKDPTRYEIRARLDDGRVIERQSVGAVSGTKGKG